MPSVFDQDTPQSEQNIAPPTEKEVDALFDRPEGEQPQPEQPAPEAPQPEAEAPPEQAQPEGEAQPEGQEAETPPEAEQKFAGRFATPEDLERGYLDVRALHERTAQERNRERQRAEQAVQVARQVYAEYQRLAQGQRPGQPGQPTPLPEGLDEETAKVIQPLIDQRVQQGVQALAQQLQERQTQAQTAAEAAAERDAAEQAISSFRQANPNLDESVVSTAFQELDYASQNFDGTPLVVDDGNLEAALEASRDPNLMRVLRLNPRLLESDEGMDHARHLATLPTIATPGARPQSQAAGADRQAQEQARTRAHVETGGPGAPPAPSKPKDEIDEMLAEAKRQHDSSVFFR